MKFIIIIGFLNLILVVNYVNSLNYCRDDCESLIRYITGQCSVVFTVLPEIRELSEINEGLSAAMEAYCGVGTINDRFCVKCDEENPGESMKSILDSSVELYNGTIIQLRQIVKGIEETKKSIIELKNSAINLSKKSISSHRRLEEFSDVIGNEDSSVISEILTTIEWMTVLNGRFSIFDIFPEKYCLENERQKLERIQQIRLKKTLENKKFKSDYLNNVKKYAEHQMQIQTRKIDGICKKYKQTGNNIFISTLLSFKNSTQIPNSRIKI